MRSTRSSRTCTLALGASLAALAAAGLTGCGSASDSTLTTAQRFAADVASAGQRADALAMTSVTHFDWDGGAFACPSDSVRDVEDALSSRWAGAPATTADGTAYALFTRSGKVIAALKLDRSAVDPCAGDAPLAARTFGPGSEFHVVAAPSGDGWVLTRAD